MLPILTGEGDLQYWCGPCFPFVFVFKDEVLVVLPVMEDEKIVFASSLSFPAAKPVSPLVVFVFKRLGF